MKNTFFAYFPFSQEFFEELWKKALIVLDANALLELYRYSESTRREFLATLRKLQRRLWIPHHAGLEFARQRPNVIVEMSNFFGRSISALKGLKGEVEKDINKELDFRIHPFLERGELIRKICKTIDDLIEEVENAKKQHPEYLQSDKILEDLLRLFEGKVGAATPEHVKDEWRKKAKERYAKDIPPGYADARKKEEERSYGDLYIWFEMIEKAKESKQPIIFVTNDSKKDWVWECGQMKVSCRPELIEEMHREAGVAFYAYASASFLSHADKMLNIKVQKKAMHEIETLQAQRRANTIASLQAMAELEESKFKHIADKIARQDLAVLESVRHITDPLVNLNASLISKAVMDSVKQFSIPDDLANLSKSVDAMVRLSGVNEDLAIPRLIASEFAPRFTREALIRGLGIDQSQLRESGLTGELGQSTLPKQES